jgi:hypothetical protein
MLSSMYNNILTNSCTPSSAFIFKTLREIINVSLYCFVIYYCTYLPLIWIPNNLNIRAQQKKKKRTVAIFVCFIVKWLIYEQCKFHVPSFNGSISKSLFYLNQNSTKWTYLSIYSHVGWVFLGRGWLGKYVDQRGMKWQRVEITL